MLLDFSVRNLDDVLAFEPIYTALRAQGHDAAFVVEPPGGRDAQTSPSEVTYDSYLESFLYLAAGDKLWIDRGRYRSAQAVITTQDSTSVATYEGLKVRLACDLTLTREFWRRPEANRGFDTVLVPGELARGWASECLPAERVKIVGNPRLAALLRGELDRKAILSELGLEPTRSTIACFGALLDTPWLVAVIRGWLSSLNVIFIVTSPISSRERALVAGLEGQARLHIEAGTPHLPAFLAVADLAVAPLGGRELAQCVCADVPTVAVARAQAANAELMEGVEAALPVCRAAGELEGLTASLLADDWTREARRALKRRLVTDLHGHDDVIAAETVIQLAACPRQEQLASRH